MTNKSAFILEDDLINLKIAQDIVHLQGFTVTTASSLQEAQAKINLAETVDVALLDLNLPDGLGVTLIPQLQARFPNIRIFLISSAQAQEIDPLLEKYPVDRFISKPFNPQQLIQALKQYFA